MKKMKMNFLIIPAKRGRKGHPKITIKSLESPDGYHILGFCNHCGTQEWSKNQEEGINIVLKKMFDMLEDR